MIRKKVCLLGAYAVGKTSLVMRFVKNMFSDRYVTTIGVKILKKELELDGEKLSLLIWDMHGDDEFQNVRTSYLRGAAAYFVVADGTRADTIHKAEELRALAMKSLGDIPSMLLVNKSDLESEWELEEGFEEPFASTGCRVVRTSAKTGDGVDAAFTELARMMCSQ